MVVQLDLLVSTGPSNIHVPHYDLISFDGSLAQGEKRLGNLRHSGGFLGGFHLPPSKISPFQVLIIQQLCGINIMYWDDKYGTHSVALDYESLDDRRLYNNALSNSFLLDDDSSILFSVDDISKSMNEIDLSEIEPPLIR